MEEGLYGSLKREVLQVNIRTEKDYSAYEMGVGRAFFEKGHDLLKALTAVLKSYAEVRRAIHSAEKSSRGRAAAAVIREIREEMASLIPGNFLMKYDLEHLRHLPRYLEAKKIRVERAGLNPEKDGSKTSQIVPHLQAYQTLKSNITPETSVEKKMALDDLRWMVEEFRVALFAPELKTAFPVSPKRLLAKRKKIESMI